MDYSITDCGTLGGTVSQGLGINSAGQVTGFSLIKGDAAGHLFSFTPGGSMRDLGLLGGMASAGNGINSFGQITGSSSTQSGPPDHAVLYTEGRLEDLNDLVPSQSLVLVEGGAINDAGQIAGTGGIQNGLRPFIYTPPNKLVDLKVTGQGKGINVSGHVTGWYSASGQTVPHKFIYAEGDSLRDLGRLHNGEDISASIISVARDLRSLHQLVFFIGGQAFSYEPTAGLTPLGTLGGDFSFGTSINGSGQVTGSSLLNGNKSSHAFLYDKVHGLRDIGGLGGDFSVGSGINSSGWVVGTSWLSGGSVPHAFFFDGATMYDLNSLVSEKSAFSVLSGASAINDAGQIAGAGLVGNEAHAFIASPVS